MMAAAAPVQYQRLIDVQATHAYRALNDVQKAVVQLLFFLYENRQYFTVEDDITLHISAYDQMATSLKALYHTPGGQAAAGNIMASLHILIEFENDEFLKSSISNYEYLGTMNAIKTLFNNQRKLPVSIPLAVVPRSGPSPWVTREEHLLDSVPQSAYDAANRLEDAKRAGIILDPLRLSRDAKNMRNALRSDVWRKLREHASGIPQSLKGYDDNKKSIEKGVVDAMAMLEQQKPRTRSRSNSRGRQNAGKPSSNRRSMRRQQHKRRRCTLNRR
jgi:hypothetical protein